MDKVALRRLGYAEELVRVRGDYGKFRISYGIYRRYNTIETTIQYALSEQGLYEQYITILCDMERILSL